MQQFGFRSVFAKLFASVMLALTLFAVAMVLLTQLVHDKDAGIRSEILATQIMGQIDPFLQDLNIAINDGGRLQARFMLAVVKKSFDIFDESLQAKMGLYDSNGRLLMQTDNSDLPLELPEMPSLMTRIFPSFSDVPPSLQSQVYSSTGYTLLYESRLPPKKPVLSAALNLFTGTLLLLIIMAGVLWLIARTMTWRINQMSQQMVQLGDGDFSVRVNARGNDEIASLAKGFNQAAQKIEHLINANNLLLAHASHELRTPITRIRLQIEMMDMLAGVMPVDTKTKFDKRASAINRDLSGLNDLVESILLVSRLDAGHVMQQFERLDLYDLVNQERQHYIEATLVGEHLVMEGQPSMLTHLIRNLLNNAMLHGVPPITILLYGVQKIEDAGVVPDYLFQSLLSSSFDYESFSYTDYQEILGQDELLFDKEPDTDTSFVTNIKAAKNSTNEHDLMLPVIYRNGESLIKLEKNDSIATAHLNKEVSIGNSAASKDHASEYDHFQVFETPVTLDLSPLHDTSVKGSHQSKTELIDSIKKAIWHVVPDKSLSQRTAFVKHSKGANRVAKKGAEKHTDKGAERGSINTKVDSLMVPRKEGLFKKHLKKPKMESTRPDHKFIVLAVIDEGAGIPKDKREEIFSPFVRLQQKKKGSGLGLSLVSQIVNAHQGRIITDTVNGHTRFLIVLPIQNDPHYNHNEHDSHDLKS